MIARHPSRAFALVALAASPALALGQGEAAAEAAAAGEVRALREQLTQLTGRVAALDAMLVRQGRRGIVLAGTGANRALVLTGTAQLPEGPSTGKTDAVLGFRRITVMADEIGPNARRSISRKAPDIGLDGQIEAKGGADIILKGNTLRSN